MATISEKKAIIELYVGWFNRAPDVDGINFWIKQFDEGSTLQKISAEFYNAAIHQFSADTGYSVGMSDDAFITQLYDGIMGRTGDLAPDATEKGYWAGKLNGEFAGDKGAMVVQMIAEIKSFDSTGNAAIKAVQDKFANKVQTAEILSVTGQTLWTGTTVAEGKAALATVTEDDATVAPAVSTALLATTEGFVLAADAATVNEGAVATFTITTNAVEDGTVVAYTIDGGVDTNDIVGGSLQGNVTIADGKATISVEVAADTTTEGLETLKVSLDGKLVEASTSIIDTSTDPQQTATSGADTFVGTANTDTFVATQDTLGLGDTFDGKEGTDSLDISISGTGAHLTGFATENVEVVKVKSLSTSASTLDMSDVKGAAELKSYETDGASLTFRDIQDTTAQISIMDTDENHTINYDVQTLSGDTDEVILNIAEIRQPAVADEGVVIDFTQNTTNADASIEKLVINSNLNKTAPATTSNDVKTLSVGDNLTSLVIKGDDATGHSNLVIRDALDKMLGTVDASALDATLNLNMSTADASVSSITFNGAKKDTTIDFGTAANTKTITTYAGNDTIITGNGTNTVDSAAGNDTITSGTGDDTIKAGDGDDTLTDAGGNNGTITNHVDMGAGNDTATFTGLGNDFIDGGAGNDTITAAAGQDNIDGGAGDDLIIESVGDLEVSDTIVGGEGTDTVRILDGDNITESEAQRVSGVEVFDLDGSGTTLTVTDNLVSTATNKSFTVDTSSATGTHTIDMTNITAPKYNFTLTGSDTASEVVIADDATINSQSTLGFGAGTADTLRIVDGATITPSDLENVTGLDAMYLESSSNISQTWDIDLELTSPITITVSPEVPDGSVLNISSTVAGVVVQHNANITVNITGTAANVTSTALLNNSANLTANADNLVGTDADETFVASDIDFLSAADVVNGNNGSDTLVLGDGGVFNGALSLHEQFNKAGISNIETITFKTDTATGVSFADIDGTTGAMEAALGTVNLTDKADTVSVGDTGITVNALAGNDTVTLIGAESGTVNGGTGDDTITGSTADDTLHGDAGADTIVGNGGNDTVDGGADNDTITTGTGNDTVTGGTGDDTVDVSSGTDSVTLGDGNDTVTVAADDLTSADTITGGAGTDTLKTSDVAMTDADFTNVTTMEVLEFNGATLGNFSNEFQQSGISEVKGSSGVDSINFSGVTNAASLTLNGNDGADLIWGGSGNDTITGGEGADILTGSTGGDLINLTETVSAADQVVFTRAEDGAQTGKNTGYDHIVGFVEGTDTIVIDGSLEAALDANAAGGNFSAALVTKTNEAALDAGAATGLAVYTNTTLQDSDLTQENFTNVLNLLNTNLQTAAAGDNVLYVVQSTTSTGLYFYQEDTGDNIINSTELKMLALVDSDLDGAALAKDVSAGDSLLTAADITDATVVTAGSSVSAILAEAAAATDEGANAVFNVNTVGATDGTVLNFTISGTGIDAADFDNNTLAGTVSITNNAGVITLPVANDVTTENAETMTVTITEDPTATASMLINDTSVTAGAFVVKTVAADTTGVIGTAEDFQYAIDSASIGGSVISTLLADVNLRDFTVGEDKLTFTDVATGTVTTATLVNEVTVSASGINNLTDIIFDANGNGDAFKLTLTGINDATLATVDMSVA